MGDISLNKISLQELAKKDYEAYCRYVSLIEDGHITWNGVLNCDSIIPKRKFTNISKNQTYNIKIINSENNDLKAVLEESNQTSKKTKN